MTYMQSAFWMVDSRCAMAIVVRPFAARSRASCTTFSEFESSAEVASSRSSTRGFRRSARAIAIRSIGECKSVIKSWHNYQTNVRF